MPNTWNIPAIRGFEQLPLPSSMSSLPFAERYPELQEIISGSPVAFGAPKIPEVLPMPEPESETPSTQGPTISPGAVIPQSVIDQVRQQFFGVSKQNPATFQGTIQRVDFNPVNQYWQQAELPTQFMQESDPYSLQRVGRI